MDFAALRQPVRNTATRQSKNTALSAADSKLFGEFYDATPFPEGDLTP